MMPPEASPLESDAPHSVTGDCCPRQRLISPTGGWNMANGYFLNRRRRRLPFDSTLNYKQQEQSKFGDLLRSKTTPTQINEALCKVLCHNICCLIQSMFELKIKPEFWADEISL
jgi:hypothetical protein